MAGWSDSFKANGIAVVAAGIGIIGGKRTFMATASQKALDGGIDVGKQFGSLVRGLGGRGGGKVNFARGGLPDDVPFEQFLSKARDIIKQVQA
jgi:alanyl-tRNA synthetase